MSIKKYTNIDSINAKIDNEGRFLQPEDLFIVSKNEIEETEFGECKYDVMEVSVYDINNNLLPQKSGNNVAYIKNSDIQSYLYILTNKGGQKELAINIEKLLNELGFTNGILKVNINFVRTKIGSDNEMQRVWIQEISPSREEIRILPLKTADTNINEKTKYEFNKINDLTKEFSFYKKNILDSLDSFERTSLSKIDDALVARFGNDFKSILKKDFGIRDLEDYNKRIFNDFKNSITNWLNNKYYDISQSDFGKQSEIRFENCEQYPFNMLMNEIQSILNNCIAYNIKPLQLRSVKYQQLPTEFAIVELRKQIQDNLTAFQTKTDIKRNIYSPSKIDVNVQGTRELPPIITIVDVPVPTDPPAKPTPPPVIEPPVVVEPPIVIAPAPTVEPTPNPNIEQPFIGGGGSTRYIPPELNGTNQYYNGFDDRGFADADTDITGRDF